MSFTFSPHSSLFVILIHSFITSLVLNSSHSQSIDIEYDSHYLHISFLSLFIRSYSYPSFIISLLITILLTSSCDSILHSLVSLRRMFQPLIVRYQFNHFYHTHFITYQDSLIINWTLTNTSNSSTIKPSSTSFQYTHCSLLLKMNGNIHTN